MLMKNRNKIRLGIRPISKIEFRDTNNHKEVSRDNKVNDYSISELKSYKRYALMQIVGGVLIGGFMIYIGIISYLSFLKILLISTGLGLSCIFILFALLILRTIKQEK